MLTPARLAAAVAVAALVPTLVHAEEDGFYGELGVGYINQTDFQTGGALGRLGYAYDTSNFTLGVVDTLAAEGEVFYGLISDEQASSFGTVDSRFSYVVASDLRASKGVTDWFDAFLRIGVSYAVAKVETDSQFTAFDAEDEDIDMLFGGGAQFNLTDRVKLRGDLASQNDTEFASVTLGVDF